MKALILFRSYYGNTKQVAETIGRRLREADYQTAVQDARAKLPELSDVDVIFNGAPTRIKRVNRRSLGVLKQLKKKGYRRPIAIFDTCAILPREAAELEKARGWIVPGAAGIMHARAKELGLNVYKDTLRCEVREMKGPLADGALQKAIAFAEAFIAENRG